MIIAISIWTLPMLPFIDGNDDVVHVHQLEILHELQNIAKSSVQLKSNKIRKCFFVTIEKIYGKEEISSQTVRKFHDWII